MIDILSHLLNLIFFFLFSLRAKANPINSYFYDLGRFQQNLVVEKKIAYKFKFPINFL